MVKRAGLPPELDQRVPGAALHPMLKAIGVARVPAPNDELFADAGPPIEVLNRLAAGLRGMNGAHFCQE